jgi:hypothetical protein
LSTLLHFSVHPRLEMTMPNPDEPEPKRLCDSVAEPSRNPPNPPLSKGGEGGFLESVANLRTNAFLS